MYTSPALDVPWFAILGTCLRVVYVCLCRYVCVSLYTHIYIYIYTRPSPIHSPPNLDNFTSNTHQTGNHDHYGGHPEAQIEYYNQKVDPAGRWVMPGRCGRDDVWVCVCFVYVHHEPGPPTDA